MTPIEFRRDPGGWQVRWNPAMAARATAEGDWPNRTVADFAAERTAAHPDRLQLIENGNAYSCTDLFGPAQRLAGHFVALGLKPGQVVSFQLPNWWEAATIVLASAMTGVVVNPIVPINRDAEVSYMLNESKSRVMIVPATFRNFDYATMMRRLLPHLPNGLQVLVARGEDHGFDDFNTIVQNASPLLTPRPVDPNDVKLLMYTSGTTGRPKGVLHSHNSINADSVKMAAAMRLDPSHTIFCPSPVTHISGFLWSLNMPWYADIPAVMTDVWEPEAAFALLRRHRCSVMVGATPFLQDLVRIVKTGRQSLDDLQHYICGGAAVPPSLIYEAADLFPHCIPWRTFGATETSTITCGPTSRDAIRFGAETDGKLYRVEAKVVDIASGQPVAAGEEGELLVRGPSMSLGYARPEDNEGAYDAEGYFRMGDLGRIIDDGHFLCTGRKKDLIIRAGENISAKEIEDVLFRSPRIAEAAVVSMPSDRTGEAICAFVVRATPTDAVDLAHMAELIAAAGLARQKTPERIVLVDELPKTPAGKVRKDQLRAQAATLSNL